MKKLLCVVAIAGLLLPSCKKEDKNSNSCEATMANIAGTYSVLKLELGAGGVFQDITSQRDACEADDKLVLNANGTVAYQDLGTACSPSGNSSGNWSVPSTGKITIDDGGSIELSMADINSFDCSTLVITGTDPGNPGISGRITLKK